jgi:hypothetical protein
MMMLRMLLLLLLLMMMIRGRKVWKGSIFPPDRIKPKTSVFRRQYLITISEQYCPSPIKSFEISLLKIVTAYLS